MFAAELKNNLSEKVILMWTLQYIRWSQLAKGGVRRLGEIVWDKGKHPVQSPSAIKLQESDPEAGRWDKLILKIEEGARIEWSPDYTTGMLVSFYG